MSNPEFLMEQEVTTSSLEQIFKRAFFKTRVDGDGDLIVQTDGPRVIVIVDQNRMLLKFASYYSCNSTATIEQKHALANKLNDSVIFCRFSISEPDSDGLIVDYYLPFEEGILPFQIVSALRRFAKITPSAISQHDEDNIVE